MTFQNPFFTSGDPEWGGDATLPVLQDGSRADRLLRGERPMPRPYNPQTDFRTVDASLRWGLSERHTRRRLNDLVAESKIQYVTVTYKGRSIQMYSVLDDSENQETSSDR